MKASQALKLAKERMLSTSNCGSRFICDNVDYVTSKHERTGNRIRKHINKLLDGNFSLHEWLYLRGHLEGAQLNMGGLVTFTSFDNAKMQRTRMLWIDDMIAYFKAKGD